MYQSYPFAFATFSLGQTLLQITEMLERLLEAMELEGRSRAEHPDDLVVPRSSDAYPSDLPW